MIETGKKWPQIVEKWSKIRKNGQKIVKNGLKFTLLECFCTKKNRKRLFDREIKARVSHTGKQQVSQLLPLPENSP